MPPIELGRVQDDGKGNYTRTWQDLDRGIIDASVRTLSSVIPIVRVSFITGSGESTTSTIVRESKSDARNTVLGDEKIVKVIEDAIAENSYRPDPQDILDIRY